MNKPGSKVRPIASDDDEAFDPARFRVDLIDPAIEAIPARKIDLGITNRVAGWFGAIPLAAAGFYPPQARLLILLAALCRLQTPDLEGGWYKLSTSRYSAVGLHDKDVRARAVAACEKAGAIETLRTRGKAVHVRFTDMARLAHDIPFKRHRKLGVQVRQGRANAIRNNVEALSAGPSGTSQNRGRRAITGGRGIFKNGVFLPLPRDTSPTGADFRIITPEYHVMRLHKAQTPVAMNRNNQAKTMSTTATGRHLSNGVSNITLILCVSGG